MRSRPARRRFPARQAARSLATPATNISPGVRLARFHASGPFSSVQSAGSLPVNWQASQSFDLRHVQGRLTIIQLALRGCVVLRGTIDAGMVGDDRGRRVRPIRGSPAIGRVGFRGTGWCGTDCRRRLCKPPRTFQHRRLSSGGNSPRRAGNRWSPPQLERRWPGRAVRCHQQFGIGDPRPDNMLNHSTARAFSCWWRSRGISEEPLYDADPLGSSRSGASIF